MAGTVHIAMGIRFFRVGTTGCCIYLEKSPCKFLTFFSKLLLTNYDSQDIIVQVLSRYGSHDADMAQSVERRLGKAEVTGSIPVISL